MTKQTEPTQKMEVCPATIALEHALMPLNQSMYLGKGRRQEEKDRTCVFDMQALAQETTAVERSFLDFPVIEWPFPDENISSKNDFSGDTKREKSLKALLKTENNWMETGFGELRSKRRRCNRLVRCRSFLSRLSLANASSLPQQTAGNE
jgi:hypothetical protein